jgi:hypothetical protein
MLQANLLQEESAAVVLEGGIGTETGTAHYFIVSLVAIAACAMAVAAAYALRKFLRARTSAQTSTDMVVLKVSVPKETRKGEGGEDAGTQKIQELISVMETIFGTLGSLKAQKGIRAWLYGRNDLFSFEIVFAHGKISFYAVCPSSLENFTEEQIHAQYPDAMIERVSDYNIFSAAGVIMGGYLTFRRPSCFPVKTYEKLETDPLNTVTNALAKLGEGEGAAVQLLVRSAPAKWRADGLRIARAMQQGKRLSEVKGGAASRMAKDVGREFSSVASGKIKQPDQKEGYRLSPLEEEMVKGIEEKASKAGLEANIRVVVSAKSPQRTQAALNDILGSFGQYSVYEYGNSFVKAVPRFRGRMITDFIHRSFSRAHAMVMNSEELASVFHFPLVTTETPKIEWLTSRKALPPSNIPETGILLGHSEYRGHSYIIRMKPEDRRRHMYIIGKSGSGKSTLIKGLAKQDIEEGRGVCIMDPHGELAREMISFVPRERADDVIYFCPADVERPMGLNMLEYNPARPQEKELAIGEMLKIFNILFDLKATGGPMFEYYMRNALLLIMDHPESGSTLLEVPKVLADEEFRRFKLSKCRNAQVKDFWIKEAQKAGGEASLANMVPYIASKLAPFITNEFMRPIIGQQKSAFSVREAMDEGKILLLDLSKGKIGDLNAYLLGMVFVGKILNAALERTDMDPSERKDFYLYIDEFQNFLTDSISAILSEARKYGLNLIIGHQFIGQLEKIKEIRDAIFGNVGSIMAFRVGPEDAEFIAKEFAPVFGPYDLMNAEAFTCNAKILINGTASRPFNFKPELHEPRQKDGELAAMIRELSRYKYGRKRELVEAEIRNRAMAFEMMEEGDE